LRNVSEKKIVEKSKTHICVQYFFFLENHTFYEIM